MNSFNRTSGLACLLMFVCEVFFLFDLIACWRSAGIKYIQYSNKSLVRITAVASLCIAAI